MLRRVYVNLFFVGGVFRFLPGDCQPLSEISFFFGETANRCRKSRFFSGRLPTVVGSLDFFRGDCQPLSEVSFFLGETANRCRKSRFFSGRLPTVVGSLVFFIGDKYRTEIMSLLLRGLSTEQKLHNIQYIYKQPIVIVFLKLRKFSFVE
jgi:hypothetical protein